MWKVECLGLDTDGLTRTYHVPGIAPKILRWISVGVLHPAELSWPPWMRINLPRHDLLGEKRLVDLSEKGLKPLSQWTFIEFSLHRYT